MVSPEQLDRLAHLALTEPPPATLALPELARRAEGRRRRATVVRAGTGLVVSLAVLVTVGWTLQRDDASSLRVAAVEPTDRGNVELAEAGIWPPGGGAPNPQALAEDFARQVLRWTDAIVTPDAARRGDPTWVTITDPATGNSLRALAVPAADVDHWRFIQIGTGLLYRPGDAGVRVELGSPPADAAQVAVYAKTGHRTLHFRGPIDDTTTSIELTGITDRRELHSILILYQTAVGQVINAAGGVIDR